MELTTEMQIHNIYPAVGQSVKEYRGADGKVTKVVTDQAEYDADLVIITGVTSKPARLKDDSV